MDYVLSVRCQIGLTIGILTESLQFLRQLLDGPLPSHCGRTRQEQLMPKGKRHLSPSFLSLARGTEPVPGGNGRQAAAVSMGLVGASLPVAEENQMWILRRPTDHAADGCRG